MAFIYHERQLGGLCGVHCLNNLLQGHHFGPGDLAEIGVQLDQQERMLLEGGDGGAASSSSSAPAAADGDGGNAPPSSSTGGLEGQAYNCDPSADGGNFSIQVLTVALQKFALQLLPAKHPHAQSLMQDPGAATEAFLCQCRDHWFAVRQVADCWWNLNSTRQRPAMVGPFYLAAWLAQLSAEGYSIFLVLCEKMPEPMKPHDPEKPEENFHEIFDLLELAKMSGGNPLAGGGDVVDEGDARAAAALQAEDDAVHMAALQREFGSPAPSSGYDHGGAAQIWSPPAGGGGGGGGLYDEMLRAHLSAQARSRQPHSEYPAGINVGWSPGWSPMESSPSPQAGPGTPPQSGGGIIQEVLRALRGCPCQWAPEEVGQDIAVPASASSPSATRARAAPARAGGVDANGRAAAHGGSPSPNGSRPNGQRLSFSPTEAPSPQALRDMGFKEPLVKVAQALGRGRHPGAAFQLLLLEPGVEPEVVADAERLARAIQEAVLNSDTTSQASFRERLVHIVALLSMDEARLREAHPHLNCEALKEFLQSVLRNRSQGWPSEVPAAASVAISLLAAFPSGAAAMEAEVSPGAPAPSSSSSAGAPQDEPQTGPVP